MPNHYHFLLETPHAELSRGLHFINGLYSQKFNFRHDRVGHLFQGRFKAILVDQDSYLWTLNRYIHNNPVKAGLVQHAWDYVWSSCRAFVGLEQPECWLETRLVLNRFGLPTDRSRGYLLFLENLDAEDPFLSCVGQTLLGSPEFISAMLKKAEPALHPHAQHAHRRSLLRRPSPDDIRAAVRRIFPASINLSGGRGRTSPVARDTAMTLLREIGGLTVHQVGSLYGLGDSGVSNCISRFKIKLQENSALKECMSRIRRELNSPGSDE